MSKVEIEDRRKYFVHLTSVTLKSLQDAVEKAREKKARQVIVGSEFSDTSFVINVELEPHTMESLGYKPINFVTSTPIHIQEKTAHEDLSGDHV